MNTIKNIALVTAVAFASAFGSGCTRGSEDTAIKNAEIAGWTGVRVLENYVTTTTSECNEGSFRIVGFDQYDTPKEAKMCCSSREGNWKGCRINPYD